MQPPHVPAWKRLGLKLKYAKDSDDQIENSAPSSKRDVEDHVLVSGTLTSESPVPTKKRRTELSATPLKTNGYDSGPLSPSLKRSNNGGLKKKVSFTAETKQLDGDSSKSLIAAWEADNQFLEDLQLQHAQMMKDRDAEQSQPQLQPRPQSEPEPEPKENEKETANAKKLVQPIPKPEKVKGRTKTRELSRPKQERRVKAKVEGKSADALDYLNQFSQNRTSWKFNKNREVWILKHILSLDDIPSSYDSTLAEYVQGLKSKGARARLTIECSEIAGKEIGNPPTGDKTVDAVNRNREKGGKGGEDDMDDPARRKAYHEDAREIFKRRFAESLDEQEANGDEDERRANEKRLAQKRRARTILENISPPEESEQGGRLMNGNIHPQRIVFNDDDADARLAAVPMNVMKRQKQHKKRTGLITVSDSSSSSSEDESESDSGDDDEVRNRTGKPVRSAISISSTEPRDEEDDSTSSSGSADASSGEEDDDDSSSDSDDQESTGPIVNLDTSSTSASSYTSQQRSFLEQPFNSEDRPASWANDSDASNSSEEDDNDSDSVSDASSGEDEDKD